MGRLPAFIWSLMIGLVCAGLYYSLLDRDTSQRETVLVTRVIDGDTIEVSGNRTVRLLNINAPEKNTPYSLLAKRYLEYYLDSPVELEITGLEKYGRFLGRLYGSNYINLDLVEKGLATSFLVDEKEQDLFNKAQKAAYNNRIGVWERSPKYGCMTIQINKKEEYLIINHSCGSLAGWILKDESTKQYKFSSEPSQFYLYSGTGSQNASAFFWSKGSVWNDDKDSLFVRDNQGKLVHYIQYGYD